MTVIDETQVASWQRRYANCTASVTVTKGITAPYLVTGLVLTPFVETIFADCKGVQSLYAGTEMCARVMAAAETFEKALARSRSGGFEEGFEEGLEAGRLAALEAFRLGKEAGSAVVAADPVMERTNRSEEGR